MNDMRLASLQLSSTSTPSISAIRCWLSIRLPHSVRALNTIFSPCPDGVMYTRRMDPLLSPCKGDANSSACSFCHLTNSSRGGSIILLPSLTGRGWGWVCSPTWSTSITTKPVSRVALCLRHAPVFPLFEVVSSNVAWKMKAGSLRFSEAS